MKINFKALGVALFMVFIAWGGNLLAKDVQVNFQWDAYSNATSQGLKEMVLFERTLPNPYDYNAPKKVIPQTITDDKGVPSTVTIDSTFPDGQNTTKAWVMRAVNDEAIQSGDSNEVTYSLNLTPLPAITDLVGVYNKVIQSIDFAWTQNDTDRVTSWQLFQADLPAGPYTKIATIPWDGSATQITASQPIDLPEPGVTKDYYFVVVSFGKDVASPDSNQVKVTIIRRPTPSKVINLKVIVQ